MIDEQKKYDKFAEKERVRKRIRASVDPSKYEFYPAKKQVDYYDDEAHRRVAVYVRVSTDDVKQTTSYELQKKYYEDFVVRHPNWTLVEIYADEGISGTSRKHRDAFNRMIDDCKRGMIDMIVCKSVSRFARNAADCLGIVRDLAGMKTPIGVFFESECIFSLNEDSRMGLTMMAGVAEEESHTRSRSMETSLRMRLDHGIPLTPKLLGYTHNAEGHLVINKEEAPTVKLAFYMYLYGYSTKQIADAFIALGRRSYLGNIKWTPGGIVQILRNERHCGDVLTRKTFTPDFRDHLAKRNRGERPQSRYIEHHEPIVSRDDFIAVQRMLDNAKFKNKSVLPELRVVDTGILKGFVVINPRWAGFKEGEYLQAARSVYGSDEALIAGTSCGDGEIKVEAEAGEFDLRGFEIARSELFNTAERPSVTFSDRKIKFSFTCVERFGSRNCIEMLVNPVTRMFAVRPTDVTNRNGVYISQRIEGKYRPRDISAAAFFATLYHLFGWHADRKYSIIGSLYEQGTELAYIFDAGDSETYFKPFMIPGSGAEDVQPITTSGKRIRAMPAEWSQTFGKQFYLHEQSYASLAKQSEADWKLLLRGELFETGKKLKVTSYEELRSYIHSQIGDLSLAEVENNAL